MLVCECGGPVVCKDGQWSGETMIEFYECPKCGREGTYRHDSQTRESSTGGCVVQDGRAV